MVLPPGSLIGRSIELAQLDSLLRSAVAGSGRIVLVEGEGGIGKTRLLDELASHAATVSAQLLRATAEEIERRRPFGAMGDCLGIARAAPEAVRAEIASLLDSGLYPTAGVPLVAQSGSSEFLVLEAMVALVEELCLRGPVMLALEDLQWADPGTLVTLHRLGRQVAQLPILLVGTCRPMPRPPELESLVASWTAQGMTHLTLGPLTEPEVAALARTLVGADVGPRLRRQLAGAGGNPLFVTELIRALERDEAIQRTPDGAAEVKGLALPMSLALTILHRLSFLYRETLEVLRVASVLGRGFPLGDLSVVVRRPAVELAPALHEAYRAGVLDDEGYRLVFRHDMIREALYQDLSPSLRTALHLEAARSLAAAGVAADRVAEHFVRGAAPGDREAVAWLQRAAAEVAGRAPAVAVDLLDAALELCDPADPARDRILADKSVGLMWSARLQEAESMCREALGRDHDPEVEGPFRLCLVQVLLAQGRMHEAVTEVESAASLILPAADKARLLAWSAHARIFSGDLPGAAETAETATALAEELGDDLSFRLALGARAGVSHFRGRSAEALEIANRALARANRSCPADAGHVQLNAFRAVFLVHLDRPEEAQLALAESPIVSDVHGATWNCIYHAASAQRLFHCGEWDDAMAECEVSMELFEDTGSGHHILPLAVLSLIALHRDELRTAHQAVGDAERRLAATGPQYGVAWMMLARALLQEAEGQPQSAFATLSTAWSLCSEAGFVSEYSVLTPDLVRLARVTGDIDFGRQIAAAVEVAAQDADAESMARTALRCRGLADDDLDTLLQAADTYRKGAPPLEQALAYEDAAVALHRAGSAAEVVPLFEEACQLYERLRAVRDLRRVQARMRAAGLRRGRRGPRKRPATGWEALTETELRVADFVAEGLSNPQIAERMFVSRRTVKTHVSHALAKLGLASRVMLAAEGARRDGGRAPV